MDKPTTERPSAKAPWPTIVAKQRPLDGHSTSGHGPPAALVVAPPGPPLWRELFDSTDHVFPAPIIPYALLSAAFFRSVHPPETLLTKLERTSLELPVMVALVLDEAPDSISLVKNPCRYIGSLLNPSVLDGLVYGFTGPHA